MNGDNNITLIHKKIDSGLNILRNTFIPNGYYAESYSISPLQVLLIHFIHLCQNRKEWPSHQLVTKYEYASDQNQYYNV